VPINTKLHSPRKEVMELGLYFILAAVSCPTYHAMLTYPGPYHLFPLAFPFPDLSYHPMMQMLIARLMLEQ